MDHADALQPLATHFSHHKCNYKLLMSSRLSLIISFPLSLLRLNRIPTAAKWWRWRSKAWPRWWRSKPWSRWWRSKPWSRWWRSKAWRTKADATKRAAVEDIVVSYYLYVLVESACAREVDLRISLWLSNWCRSGSSSEDRKND
jgi:hypothetical protein